MSSHILWLLMTVHVAAVDRPAVARELRHAPDPDLVAAIIEHESRGRAHVCREDQGGSSRGHMQIWRPNSRCTPDDDSRYAADYDPATNVHRGIRLLRKLGAFRRHGRHDPLAGYAGQGKAARRFARDVRRRAEQLRRRLA